MIIILTAGFLLLRSYGSEIAGGILKDLVAKQTLNRYNLDFSTIEILAIKNEILIENLLLTKKINLETDTARQVYKIFVPKLELGLESLVSIYFGRELIFKSIKIHDPEISITKGNNQGSKTTFSLETGTLYNSISDYLSLFKITNFDIQNGMVNYSRDNRDNPLDIFVNQIDFSIANFQLDSAASDTTKFFYTDKIELIISNQNFDLADSIHQVSFDEFHISTSTEDILFKNLNLTPRKEIDIQTLESYFIIQIPELNFRGLDFQNAYSENHLLLDSVRILNPNIEIRSDKTGKKMKNLNLLELSTKLFEAVDVGKLFLDNADVSIHMINDQMNERYQARALSLQVNDLYIDSTRTNPAEWMHIFKEIALEASDFQTHIMDSTHFLQVNQLAYSSIKAKLTLDGIYINPVSGSRAENNKFSIRIRGIESTGLTTLNELVTGHLMMDKLEIKNPDIELQLVEQKTDDPKSLLFLKSLKLGQFSLVDANLILKQSDTDVAIENLDIYMGKVNFKPSDLEYFVFNNFTPDSHIKLESLNLNSKEIQLKLNHLGLNNWKDLSANDLFIKPNTTPEPFTFSEVRVTAFDLDHFLHNQLLSFDSLILDEPIINLHPGKHNENNSIKLRTWAHHTTFKEVKLTNGKLTKFGDSTIQVHMENFDMELSKFHYDSLRDEYYTLVGYRADSLYLHLEKMNHQITGTDFSISIKDSTFHAKQLHIQPRSHKSPNQINVSTRELRLHQIDFHRLINQQQIHFYDGYLLSPKVNVVIEKENNTQNDLEKDLLKFTSLNISNGLIHLENHISDSSMIVDANRINVLINHFDLGKDSSIFSAQNYLADFQHLSLKRYSDDDPVTIKRAFINTKKGNIQIAGLEIKASDQLNLNFPKIEIVGLDPEKLAHTKSYIFDSLIIDQPEITLDLNMPAALKKNNRQVIIPTVAINNISLNNGRSSFRTKEFNFDQPVSFSEINCNIDSFKIDSTTTLLTLSETLKKTNFSLADFSFLTADSLYQIQLNSLQYDGEHNRVIARNIDLNPLFSRNEFQDQIAYQKDWFDLRISNVILDDPDYKKYITENLLELKEITVNNFSLDTHRDKRLPVPPDLVKPLPQQLISEIPLPFYVDKISVKSSFISHSEFSPTGTLPGSIFFNNLNAEITNITNDAKMLELDSIMVFHAKGNMMTTGLFDVNVKFNLKDTGQYFLFDGTLKNMNLTELNRLLEHTAFVHIKDGFNKYVEFNFEANNKYALGTMKFYYNDLKITVLNPEDATNKGHGASIKSFFANTFVVNKKNPHFLFVREGDIFYYRDTNKAIFNYWAKALLSGVVSSIGAKNNKKEIKKLNDQIKAEIDQKSGKSRKNNGSK
ncbi:MAG: hypothetical protein ACI8TA_001017 [Cyclobacteriaceae bacterium]